MVKHREVAEAFVRGTKNITGSRMFVEDYIIYSYGRHFPMSKHLKENIYLFNSKGYSCSTSRHKSYVANALGSRNILIRLPDCDTNKAQEQTDTNMAEIHVCLQKLTRARKPERIIEEIEELMEQNQLIKKHIQNVTETPINIWKLVEQLKNKLTPELYTKLEEVRTKMLLRRI